MKDRKIKSLNPKRNIIKIIINKKKKKHQWTNDQKTNKDEVKTEENADTKEVVKEPYVISATYTVPKGVKNLKDLFK